MSFTIRELESLTGIRAHTIRIWEQRYNFLKPSRTQTNIRTYNNEELKTLMNVALLNRYGYKISRIDEMQAEQRVSAIMQLPGEDAYDEHLVNKMMGCMIDLKSVEFEELLNQHILEAGIEKAITGVIFQFLDKVGLLWQTSRIVPVQEHIVSNIIRQKIVAAIENLPFGGQGGPLCLLFLPEDEHHEMGLLFVYYLLRRKNIPVIYLGANVPVKDVHYLAKMKAPDFYYIHLTSFPRQHIFHKYLTQLAADGARAKIIISGSAVATYKKPLPDSVSFLPTFSAVMSFVENI